MEPATTTPRTPRSVSLTDDRYEQVAQSLNQLDYASEADDKSDWVTVIGPDGLKACLRVYDTPSKFGINEGYISKMSIH